MSDRHVVKAVCGNGFRERSSGLFAAWYDWAEQFKLILGDYPWNRRYMRFWDADHIEPVDEGGGLCGLENYQTLCINCHKKKTAEQKQRKAARAAERRSKMADKPTPKEMTQALKTWLQDEDNKPQRLISGTKFKELAKAIDPDIRFTADFHGVLCREVGLMIKKAMQRCYDNKRATLRPLDL